MNGGRGSLLRSPEFGAAIRTALAAAGIAPAILLLATSCRGPAQAPDGSGSGTRRMAGRLDDLARNMDPTKNRFQNAERAKLARIAMDRTDDPARRTMLRIACAGDLLKMGATEQAIALVQPLLAPDAAGPGTPPIDQTREFLALCLYRLGVQENCMAHPNPERCLMPIRGRGVHTEPRGARAAIEQLKALLAARPDDLGARWMLNVASMALGEYPEKVPPRFLIPPRAFEPEYDVKRFPNIAPRVGLGIITHAGGAIMEDFDGDGLLDVMVSAMGLWDQLRLFHNDGDGTFSDRTEPAGITGEVGGLNAVDADYDNDGDVDVLVLRGGWAQAGGRFPNSLLRNNGDGTFEDVTEEAGILSFHPTQTGSWGDYDGDGWLDLVIGNESMKEDPHPCELYHNNRDGTFTDRSIDLGNADLGYVKAVVWGDYDNDGRPDLYVSALDGDNHLFRNDGKRTSFLSGRAGWRFTDVSREAGVAGPRDSFPTWFWDYDNDGWLDLLVAGFKITGVGDVASMYLGMTPRTQMPVLYRNNHDGTFTDVSRDARIDRVAITMGSNFGDLDNDGWPDPYFGTGEPDLRSVIPNRLFRNAGGKFFQEVTASAGVGHLQKGHGVAFGDIDNDGDQDIFEEMGGFYEGDVAQSVLYENPGHGNHWITLRLEGRRSNRSAIGARIKVQVATPRGPRDIHATVGTGGSFGGNSLQQEIGLGDASSIIAIEVSWPTTGKVQVFRDVALDRVYRIVEGEVGLKPVAVKSFKF